jgi:predicted dehydrogenase
MKQRIYIIGTGVISHHHANARKALPRETELYAADLSSTARESFRKEFPDVILFESSDEMLAHAPAQEFDIVCVCTPPKFHHSETIKALQSGRNVVCEKPFAMTMEEAQEMVDTAKKHGLNVSCCSNRFIGWKGNLKTKELISSGEIGQPYLVDFIHRKPCFRNGVDALPGSYWFLDVSKAGGGELTDWGPYDMAVLLSIFEPVKVTISDAHTMSIPIRHGIPDEVVYDIDTHATASLCFETANGNHITIRYERGGGFHGDALETEGIYGTEGHIKWDWLPFSENPRVAVQKTKAPGLADVIVYPVTKQPQEESWVHAPLREFDRFLRGDANAMVLVNEKALQSFNILRAIYEVSETGNPVTLDLV